MSDRIYRILLDGQWSLEDLMNFSRVYFQNYSFLYCLETESIGIASDRIESVLENYELRHGLSYVNIYEIFRSHVAKDDIPQISSIQYSSPGWIDLVLNPEVAQQFAKTLAIYLGCLVAAGQTYKNLYQIYIDLSAKRRKLGSTTLKLKAKDAKKARKLNKELAAGLGFQSLQELDEHTKDVEESSKLLMAHYRRMKKIARFVTSGKASFPEDNSE